VEAAVLALRAEHGAWGGRKIARRLADLGQAALAPSTVTAILRRHGLIDPAEAAQRGGFVRFERAAPNELWQMDFKGHFAHGEGRCHALTVLDDHSRFALCLAACGQESTAIVRDRLRAAFGRYGLPQAMLMDNGSPWGASHGGDPGPARFTPLTVWLMRLGIRVSHGRPYHPQTQGKEERFHRTLKAEVLQHRSFRDLAACQAAFDHWRQIYNLQRPHQALGLAVPASRYQPSRRAFPAVLPALEYGPDDHVRKVQHGGWISFRGRELRLPRAFRGHPVALRPTTTDGLWQVFFGVQLIAELDLLGQPATLKPVNHVPEHL
jgi:transposase InsO family protein